MIAYDGFLGLYKHDLLIGYIYCRLFGSYAHLQRIGILSTERGKGFGSLLFENVISYFESYKKPKFSLYVETRNNLALNLYNKYGMKILFQSWHFIITLDNHEKYRKNFIGKTTIRELEIQDLPNLSPVFPNANLLELKGMMEEVRTNNFLLMKDGEKIVAIARFNKKFAGCRPFFIKDVTYFDTFIEHLIKIRDSQKNYVRITFDDNDALAELCKKRKYVVHHHLYKMERE